MEKKYQNADIYPIISVSTLNANGLNINNQK